MRSRMPFLASLSLVLMAGGLRAQEPVEPVVDPEEGRPSPVREIKVLDNPYDIASFYRSSQGPRQRFFGYQPDGAAYGSGRYPIAGYYRQRPGVNAYGYAPFWTNGYSSRTRAGLAIGYRRSIGENGDIVLFAPTFLAPVGPLTTIFFDGRVPIP